MAALTATRDTDRKVSAHDQKREYKIAANVRIFAGSLVVINSVGKAAPGTTATTHRVCAGRAIKEYNNTGGAADAMTVEVEEGVFKWANLGADAVVAADVGADCFIADDQTVAKTNGTSTRSRAGIVMGVDSDGVWVQCGAGL
jgi:hypothetical protein